MKTQSTELARIPFYGDTLLATQVKDRCYTSLKRACENIGVDFDSQRKKLNGYKWATTLIIKAVAEDGKQRQVTMIDVRSLPMWLVTIHPSKVAFDVRDKLERYQMEAAEVLANFYLGQKRGDNLPAVKRKLDRQAQA